MPSALLSPGVYIEEVPSGVRTITGVATSIAAFIGRTSQGPVSEPALITSFGDFERLFGGVQMDYPLSYAVQDFYLNGGSQAIIVRLASGAVAASAALLTGGADNEALDLVASSPGTWGNALTGDVDDVTATRRHRALQPHDQPGRRRHGEVPRTSHPARPARASWPACSTAARCSPRWRWTAAATGSRPPPGPARHRHVRRRRRQWPIWRTPTTSAPRA